VLLSATDLQGPAAEVIAWLEATTDSFQCGPSAFLVRDCEEEELTLALERRLPHTEGYFICTVDYPASFRRDPADLSPFVQWLFKGAITTAASPGQYSFCTRCGARVVPYTAYQEDGVRLLRHDKPLKLYRDLFGGNGCYWCSSCGSLWRALRRDETSRELACGHVVPLYASYCATCGTEANGESPS
jgi:hypothetical protein